MKRIIDGLRYDTATAEPIATFTNGFGQSDFKWDNSAIYKTKKGRYFIAGRGGPKSRWATQVNNTTSGGEGIMTLTDTQAREMLEEWEANDALEEHFPIEDA
jgi:hypothetical protein